VVVVVDVAPIVVVDIAIVLVVLLDVVVGTVLDVEVVAAIVVVVEVVVVDVVLDAIEVVVVPGTSVPAAEPTHVSTIASRLAASLVFEQSVAAASFSIAAANFVSAADRHGDGSVPLPAWAEMQRSLAAAFLATAVTFLESHRLRVGSIAVAPTAASTVLSQSPRTESTAVALPGHGPLASAFEKSFDRPAFGLVSQPAAPPGRPFASAFASQLSLPETALAAALSLAALHVSALAIAGGARSATDSKNPVAKRIHLMIGPSSNRRRARRRARHHMVGGHA
jgi:hypothetical protein